ncbi:MAG: hypothetical protein CMN78_01210 [Spirochaetales bacterium]|nr:hypothetical protein [Spirochaetales bacterium]
MQSDRITEWEGNLKKVFDMIDDEVEDKFGRLYPLHPARPPRGMTASREQDGLFNIGASFSAGFGSTFGRGYVIDIDMVTLRSVPVTVKRQVEETVVKRLREELPKYFPGKNLQVQKDGEVFKIFGDLSFGRSKQI